MATARTGGRPSGARRARAADGLRVVLVDGLGRPVAVRGLAAWLTRVAPSTARGVMTLALASDRQVRRLNRRHRGVDRTTDVLSFGSPLGRRGRNNAASAPVAADRLLGEVVIARGAAKRQAKTAGHAYAVELRVLALHGLLHLMGFDHARDDGRMARTERHLRRKGGLGAGLIERSA